LEALKENAEELQEVPSGLLEQSQPEVIKGLMSDAGEEYQERSNQEWLSLVQQEQDPLEASKLILDWVNDKAQAKNEMSETSDAASDPHQSLTE
jgi:hypothetical protein